MSARVLVVDDEAGFRRSLAIALRRAERDGRAEYAVVEASGVPAALAELESQAFDLVITDLRMQDATGLDLLDQIKRTWPHTEVIVMTAYGTIEVAVGAMKRGAFDFVTKPFQIDEILHRTSNAVERASLRREVHALRAEATRSRALSAIVGVSTATQELLKILPRAADVESNVLITGESGTGKDLAARAIHDLSRRANGPFIAMSCAAIPVELLESELFGHVKGAFSGAHATRKGLMEEASGGTLFLDEVGEAPHGIQTKLLRVLEERVIRRVGDNRSIPVDIRVVAATNSDLAEAIEQKKFRNDLYFRLNVIRLRLLPLRERPEDIVVLARHFLAKHAAKVGRTFDGFAPEAIEALARHQFPGNARELSNIVEQAVAFSTGAVIELDDLRDVIRDKDDSPSANEHGTRRPLDSMERELIIRQIKARGGDLQAIAEDLKMSRTTLWRRMKQYNIESEP